MLLRVRVRARMRLGVPFATRLGVVTAFLFLLASNAVHAKGMGSMRMTAELDGSILGRGHDHGAGGAICVAPQRPPSFGDQGVVLRNTSAANDSLLSAQEASGAEDSGRGLWDAEEAPGRALGDDARAAIVDDARTGSAMRNEQAILLGIALMASFAIVVIFAIILGDVLCLVLQILRAGCSQAAITAVHVVAVLSLQTVLAVWRIARGSTLLITAIVGLTLQGQLGTILLGIALVASFAIIVIFAITRAAAGVCFVAAGLFPSLLRPGWVLLRCGWVVLQISVHVFAVLSRTVVWVALLTTQTVLAVWRITRGSTPLQFACALKFCFSCFAASGLAGKQWCDVGMALVLAWMMASILVVVLGGGEVSTRQPEGPKKLNGKKKRCWAGERWLIRDSTTAVVFTGTSPSDGVLIRGNWFTSKRLMSPGMSRMFLCSLIPLSVRSTKPSSNHKKGTAKSATSMLPFVLKSFAIVSLATMFAITLPWQAARWPEETAGGLSLGLKQTSCFALPLLLPSIVCAAAIISDPNIDRVQDLNHVVVSGILLFNGALQVVTDIIFVVVLLLVLRCQQGCMFLARNPAASSSEPRPFPRGAEPEEAKEEATVHMQPGLRGGMSTVEAVFSRVWMPSAHAFGCTWMLNQTESGELLVPVALPALVILWSLVFLLVFPKATQKQPEILPPAEVPAPASTITPREQKFFHFHVSSVENHKQIALEGVVTVEDAKLALAALIPRKEFWLKHCGHTLNNGEKLPENCNAEYPIEVHFRLPGGGGGGGGVFSALDEMGVQLSNATGATTTTPTLHLSENVVPDSAATGNASQHAASINEQDAVEEEAQDAVPNVAAKLAAKEKELQDMKRELEGEKQQNASLASQLVDLTAQLAAANATAATPAPASSEASASVLVAAKDEEFHRKEQEELQHTHKEIANTTTIALPAPASSGASSEESQSAPAADTNEPATFAALGKGKHADIKSKAAKGAIVKWQMSGWSGAKLLADFKSMDSDTSNGIDKKELTAFVKNNVFFKQFGKWAEEDVNELFGILDVDKNGSISVQDFALAVMGPLQEEQVEGAIRAPEIVKVLCADLPVPKVKDGIVPNALCELVKLSAKQIQEKLLGSIGAVAQQIYANLEEHRKALLEQTKTKDTAPAETKFTFSFADVSQSEEGAVAKKLGLPSNDIEKAMIEEHKSEENWTTGNYNLKTNPKQEFEFVDSPQDKIYPGEGKDGRRRQDATKVWKVQHDKLPVAEALQSFQSKLGKLDLKRFVAAVEGLMKSHTSEMHKRESFAKELRAPLMEALGISKSDGAPASLDFERVDASILEAAGFAKGYSDRWRDDARAWVERHLELEVREVEELLAGWDLSLAEIKSVMLYTGPLFEKYNKVLRSLDSGNGDVEYKNTLLMLNSSVMKLLKRTVLSGNRKVYRGLKGGELPPEWMVEGLTGSRGGAEAAFMSTSTNWKEAAKYASRGGSPVLLEIDLGKIDKGADIAELSQYPGEAEILFPPMTFLEVQGMPRLMTHEGKDMMVLKMRTNVSVRNETREALLAKRKAVYLPSLANTIQEAQRDLDALAASKGNTCAVLSAMGWRSMEELKKIVMDDCKAVEAQYIARAPDWYTHDQHYQVAVQEAAQLKQLALAKLRAILEVQVTAKDEYASEKEAEAFFDAWKPKHLGVVDAEELNKRTRLWEASCTPAVTSTDLRRLPSVVSWWEGGSAAARKMTQRMERALALCEWQGLLDCNDVDMVMDLAGHTTLLLAALKGQDEKVQLLLDAGCSPDKANKAGRTPLHLAAMSGHAGVVKYLLEARANKEVSDEYGYTPVCIAAEKGQTEAVAALIAAKCNVDTANGKGKTPVWAAAREGRTEAVAALIAAKCNVDTPETGEGKTPVWAAAEEGHTEAVAALIAAKCNVDTAATGEFWEGITPVWIAAGNRHPETVAALIAAKCNVDTASSTAMLNEEGTGGGKTPLYVAAEKDCSEAVAALIAAKCNVDKADIEDVTPLVVAASYGSVEIVRQLLAAGADRTVQTQHGSALNIIQYGVEDEGKRAELEELLRFYGESALFVAAAKGETEEVAKLIAAKCNVDEANTKGQTPLGIAAANGHKEAALQVLVASKRCSVGPSQGWRAAHYALYLGAEELAARLVVEEEGGAEAVEARLQAVRDDVLASAYSEAQPLVLFAIEPSLDAMISTVDRTVTFNKFSTVRFKHGCAGDKKAYYELTIKQPLYAPQVGFASSRLEATELPEGFGVGDNNKSWGVDGHRCKKWHGGPTEEYGAKWSAGDVIGLAWDGAKRQMLVSVNGDFAPPNGVVFEPDPDAAAVNMHAAFTAAEGVVEYNFGEEGRAFAHEPPAPDFVGFGMLAHSSECRTGSELGAPMAQTQSRSSGYGAPSQDQPQAGIGVVWSVANGNRLKVEMFANVSAGADAGMQQGDELIAVDNRSIIATDGSVGVPFEEVVRMITGPTGSKVQLTLRRATGTVVLDVYRRPRA